MQRLFLLSWRLFIAVLLLFPAISALADGSHPQGVIVDGTIGNSGRVELTGPTYDITANLGRQAGANLFHSFERFNIHTNEQAVFSGPDSIQNIISRVTGGSSSWIDGIIRSDITGANLFLLNPHGVMFGANATLNISGAFHTTTADYLRLADGQRFYSTPQQNEILSTAAPDAFGFLDNNTGGISLESGGSLGVADGQTISLIGSEVTLDGIVRSPTGRLNIAATASAGELVMSDSGLDATAFSQMGPITGNDGTTLDVSQGGGRIFIRGGRFLFDGARVDATTVDTAGGEIDINVDVFDMANGAILDVDTRGTGDGADIAIQASESVTLSGTNSSGDGSRIFAGTHDDASGIAAGTAGSLTIRAPRIRFADRAVIGSQSFGGGIAGTVILRTNRLTVADEALISVEALDGLGGDLEVTGLNGRGDPAESITFSGISPDNSTVNAKTGGEGGGGLVYLEAETISLIDGAVINSETTGTGTGGDIQFIGTDILIESDSLLSAETRGAGTGGQVDITATNLSLKTGSTISVNTTATGQGGNLTLDLSGSLTLSGVGDGGDSSHLLADSTSTDGNGGAAGSIAITADQIQFTDEAFIASQTLGGGAAGLVEIRASDITFDGASSLSAETKGSGAGGDIQITGTNLNLLNGSAISLDAFDTGSGGNLTIDLTGTMRMAGTSPGNAAADIFAEALKEDADGGDAGFVTISADTLEMRDAAFIGTRTFGGGTAGLVQLETRHLSLIGGSHISTTTRGSGASGEINILGHDTDIADLVEILGSDNDGHHSRLESATESTADDAGDAGFIAISANTVRLEGGRINASTRGPGLAGAIEINTTRFEMLFGSAISSTSRFAGSGGDAGEIIITAEDTILLSDNSTITTDGTNAGGGQIKINATNMLRLTDSRLTTNVRRGTGNGGDITIDPRFVILNGSTISANADEGDGGAVFITTDHFLKSTDSQVTASSNRGNQGTVEIESPDVDVVGGILVLPTNFLDAGQWASTPCAARSGEAVGRFVLTGPDAVPTFFDDWLASPSPVAGDCSKTLQPETTPLRHYLNLSTLLDQAISVSQELDQEDDEACGLCQ